MQWYVVSMCYILRSVRLCQKCETLSEVALANVEAFADFDPSINPECPNGCVSDGDGCYCYHKYADYKEAKWS